MKYIALVSRDKKHFKVFTLNIIRRIDVCKLNSNPDDDSRGICVFEQYSCTHTYKIVSFDFDQFASFINEDQIGDDIFIINVEQIEVENEI
jgi:hypothetical protein